jgi:hypothetical protein
VNPYKNKLDEMTFSFSRLTTFERCPYCFYLTYIEETPKIDNAFAQYGILCHNLLEKYAKNEVFIFDLLDQYINSFETCVNKSFPPNKYVNLRDSYYKNGYEYFQDFAGFESYKILGVEKKVNFNIQQYHFVGYIDLLVQNKKGEIEVIDHKSKKLHKPAKSTWNNIKRRRETELYQYLRQLYIYSVPIIEQQNMIPKYLNFNCFRTNKWIKIPFDMEDYAESKEWALNIIKSIYVDNKMTKRYEKDFFCNQLCSVRSACEYSNDYLGGII